MSNDRPLIPDVGAPESAPGAKVPLRHLSSRELFAGARELIIDHDGRLYQLRITQNGKLILTA